MRVKRSVTPLSRPMLPADVTRCHDHGECPRGTHCARAATPVSTPAHIWFAAFFAQYGAGCAHYVPMPERAAESGRFARRAA
jgi:hypothetical protein